MHKKERICGRINTNTQHNLHRTLNEDKIRSTNGQETTLVLFRQQEQLTNHEDLRQIFSFKMVRRKTNWNHISSCLVAREIPLESEKKSKKKKKTVLSSFSSLLVCEFWPFRFLGGADQTFIRLKSVYWQAESLHDVTHEQV